MISTEEAKVIVENAPEWATCWSENDGLTFGEYSTVVNGSFCDCNGYELITSCRHTLLSDMKQANRNNSGKPQLSLILEAPVALAGLASVLEGGVTEYGRGNWKKGLDRDETIDSLLRHVVAMLNGEEFDEKTGKHNSFHILANALFLAEQHSNPKSKGE